MPRLPIILRRSFEGRRIRPRFVALVVCLLSTAGLIAGASVATAVSGAATINDTTVGTGSGTFAYAGTWSTSTGAGKYLGNDRYSSATGSSYTFRFSGTKVTLYGAKASHDGQASVRIDGGTAVTTVKGTRQAASTGNVISIDRAVVSG